MVGTSKVPTRYLHPSPSAKVRQKGTVFLMKNTKFKYEFLNGDKVIIEVEEDFEKILRRLNKDEKNQNKKEHRHCYSSNAAVYEGKDYGVEDYYECLDERKARIAEAFSKLTPTQQRRLLLRLDGLKIKEICKIEGVKRDAVKESIAAGKKKFIKNFLKSTPKKRS